MRVSWIGSGHRPWRSVARRRRAPRETSLKRRIGAPATPPSTCIFPVFNRWSERKLPESEIRCSGSAHLLAVLELGERVLDVAREDVFGRALVLQRDLGDHLTLVGDAVDRDAQG